MKNVLNKPESPQSYTLYCKVKTAFQFSPQGETGMPLTPALSRPTGEGELFAATRDIVSRRMRERREAS